MLIQLSFTLSTVKMERSQIPLIKEFAEINNNNNHAMGTYSVFKVPKIPSS